MNIPEDPFKHFRAVSDPLKSVSGILNSLPTEPPYMRHLENVTGTAYAREMERLQNQVLKSNVYTSEVERIEEYLRKGSAVSNALELAQQALGRNSFESIQLATATALGRTAYDMSRATLPQDADRFNEIAYLSLEAKRHFFAFDSYQRATSWLDPLRDIQSQGTLSTLEKYKSLAAATDPLRIYRDAMDALTKSPFRNVGDSHLEGIFDSLSRIAADISRDSFNDDDIELEQDDVAGYRDLARNSTKGITVSRKDIEDLVTHFISSYQQLTGARERKIFATYIYPLLLALVFSYINPYNDFLEAKA